MNALFHCEASSAIGTGHVFRCLTLANALAEKGWVCAFFCSEETLETVPALQSSGLEIHHSRDSIEAFYDIIVIDNYDIAAATEQTFRGICTKIVVIDDLANRMHACDVLLDQTLDCEASHYSAFVPSVCNILAGVPYALLRPEFIELRGEAMQRREENAGRVKSLFVTMGGTDPHNVTSLVLSSLDYVDSDLKVDVILSQSAPHKDKIAQQCVLLRDKGFEIDLHFSISDMGRMMMEADLAIGAGGTTSWERCCLSLPTLMVEIADNQAFVAKALHNSGAVVNLGKAAQLKAEDVAEGINSLLNSPKDVQKMGIKAAGICDGFGIHRLIPYLIDQDQLWLRRMEEDDMRTLFEWQQLESTRKHARNPKPPVWEEHEEWFMKQISDPRSQLYMIVYKGDNAGMLRLDSYQHEAESSRSFEISILLDPKYYKKGVASDTLKLVRKIEPIADLYAEILSENKASRKLFQRLDYRPVTDTLFVQKAAK